MRKCIHAYTPAGMEMPPHFNLTDTGDGSHAEIIVRDHAQMVQHENGAHLEAGHHTTLAVHRDELVALARSILEWAGYTRTVQTVEVPPDFDIDEFRRRWQEIAGENVRPVFVPIAVSNEGAVVVSDNFSRGHGFPQRDAGDECACGPCKAPLAVMEIIGDGPRAG